MMGNNGGVNTPIPTLVCKTVGITHCFMLYGGKKEWVYQPVFRTLVCKKGIENNPIPSIVYNEKGLARISTSLLPPIKLTSQSFIGSASHPHFLPTTPNDIWRTEGINLYRRCIQNMFYQLCITEFTEI